MTPLATAQELADFTGRPIPTAQADLLLELASGAVRAHCGWHISPSVTETLTLDGVPERVLLLPSGHVTAVSAVTVDGATLDPGSYEWSALGRLWAPGGWRWDYRTLTVDLTHGYADVPPVVKGATLAVASRQAVNPEGLKALTVGGIARTFATNGSADTGVALTATEQVVLAAYRIQGRP